MTLHCKPIVKKGKKHGHKQPPQFFGFQIIEVIVISIADSEFRRCWKLVIMFILFIVKRKE